MPNRYIREAAIKSEAVNALSWHGEVFYRRLLNRVDDFGRYHAHPSLLRADIFPLQLDKVRDSDIPRLLAECEKSGLVFVYSANGKQYLVINKWEKGRAKTSDYPEPPADICERMQTFVYRCKRMHPTPTPTPITDPDADPDIGANGSPPARKAVDDETWLAELSASPAYTGIDVRRELAKMQAWCSANGKQPSRRRFINWLNRAERPLKAGANRQILSEHLDWDHPNFKQEIAK